MADILTSDTYAAIKAALDSITPKGKTTRASVLRYKRVLSKDVPQRPVLNLELNSSINMKRIFRALWQGKVVYLWVDRENDRYCQLFLDSDGILQVNKQNLVEYEREQVYRLVSSLAISEYRRETAFYNSRHPWLTHRFELLEDEADSAPTHNGQKPVAITFPGTDDVSLEFFHGASLQGSSIKFHSEAAEGTLTYPDGHTETFPFRGVFEFFFSSNKVDIKDASFTSAQHNFYNSPWFYQPLTRLVAPHIRTPHYLHNNTVGKFPQDWVFSGAEHPLFPGDKDVERLGEILSDIESSKITPDTETRYTPVTQGVCEPGKIGFGLEIEFIADGHHSHSGVREAIARELYRSDLSWDDEYKGWHWNGRYAPEPYTKWSVEHDATVTGEVISPILYDTEETWETLDKVLTIIREAGGTVDIRCGQHIHMGVIPPGRFARPSSIAKRQAAVMHLYAGYEDAIRRVQADPTRKSHRNGGYSLPLSEQRRSNIDRWLRELSNNNLVEANHETALNLGFSSRVEFRGADGSLGLRHIRANVAIAAALVGRARSFAGELPEEPLLQGVGYNATRLAAIADLALDEQQKAVAGELGFAHFLYDLFEGNSEGYREVLAVGAGNPWQQRGGSSRSAWGFSE